MLLSIDIGGTNIKHGFIDKNGNIFEENYFKTPNSYDELLNKIEQIIATHNSKLKIIGIAISSAGVVLEDGFITGYSAVEFILEKNMKKIFESRFNLRTEIENDANCSSISYKWKLKDIKSLVSIAIGTGLGGSIILNNSLIKGKNGFAGEFGMLVDFEQDKLMYQGYKTSMFHLRNNVNKNCNKDFNSAVEVFKVENHNDVCVKDHYENWYNNLVKLVLNIQFSIDPEIIQFTGGITNNKDFISTFNKKFDTLLKENEIEKLNTNIIVSPYNGNANIFGAAYNWYERNKKI